MQDSFDARMHGDVPASVKHKSNIGWIIALAILLVGLVALIVMQVLAYQEIARKDNEISELKNKPATTQAEVKEPTEAEVATDKISVDLNGLKEQMIIDTGVPKDKFVLQNANILTQSEQKYIVVDASYGSTGGSGAAIVYYKENNSSDSKWKKLWEGHQMTCSGLNSEQKTVLKGIKFCLSDDGYSVLVGE